MDATLEKLIQAIQNLAPQVWAIYIRQMYINGIVDVFWGIIGIIASILLVVWAKKLWKMRAEKKKKSEYADTGVEEVFTGVFLCSAALFGSIAISVLMTGIQYILNPQYYAIQTFLSLVK